MTIVAREQAQAIDAKAAPGLLRYRFGVKGVCISEDLLGNGFRINGFYEYLIPAPGRAPRKMMTNKKVGRLILHGRLKRSYARILELRKSVGQSAQIRHPRQSLKAQDPIPSDAVLEILIRGDDGLLHEDTSRPPFLTPISTLGSAVTLLELTAPSCAAPGSYCLDETLDDCGGPKLPKHLKLTPQLFNAASMRHRSDATDFEKMKTRSLKNEMAARGLTVRSGLKADLQHRLYSEIVRAAAEEAMGDHGYYTIFGSDSSDSSMDDDE